jgi:hypothetical protein
LPGGRRQSRVNRYSVFYAIDTNGAVRDHGRIDHTAPELFVALFKRHPGSRVTCETTLSGRASRDQALPRHFPKVQTQRDFGMSSVGEFFEFSLLEHF